MTSLSLRKIPLAPLFWKDPTKSRRRVLDRLSSFSKFTWTVWTPMAVCICRKLFSVICMPNGSLKNSQISKNAPQIRILWETKSPEGSYGAQTILLCLPIMFVTVSRHQASGAHFQFLQSTLVQCFGLRFVSYSSEATVADTGLMDSSWVEVSLKRY
jgi:hypothetical protein